jgi:formamidopyrimidine-DNA glycosylase
MPELPEVETVRRGLETALVGHRISEVQVRRADLRWPLPRDLGRRLAGRKVLGLRRRAKYILVRVEGGETLLLHLGMSGRLLLTAGRPNVLDAHDHVLIATESGIFLRFNDARRFGSLDLVATATVDRHRLLSRLGPEPLDRRFDGAALARALAGKKTPIKSALLDQRVVAGIGNIYACEALFRAGISPRRQARTVGRDKARRLAAAIKKVLREAIAAGGSTLKDHVRPTGELGYFQHRFQVYDREGRPCPGCDCRGAIRRIVQSGRSTFYCAKRQR